MNSKCSSSKIRRPNLFIVGEPKSGTTALHNFLNQHPEIFMCSPKEPHHFETDFIKESIKFHRKKIKHFVYSREKYLDLFKNAGSAKFIGESSTDYLYSKEAAKNIYNLNPDAKIIIMLREPVDFLYSLHSEYVFQLSETEDDFRRALKLESLRKKGKRLPKRAPYPSYLFYSERIKYYSHTKRFLAFFDSAQIKIILFTDFKKNNRKIYNDVLDFLGLENFKISFRIVNPNKAVKMKMVKGFTESLVLQERLRRVLPFSVYKRVSHVYRKLVFKSGPRKKLDNSLKESLMIKFKPEVLKLEKLINLDLIKLWGYDRF